MQNGLVFAVAVIVAGVLINQVTSFIVPWSLKPRCPVEPTRLKLKENNENKFRGSCEVLGWREDTCKGSQLACCENIMGIFLCVKPEKIEQRRQADFANFRKSLFGSMTNPFENNPFNGNEQDPRCPQIDLMDVAIEGFQCHFNEMYNHCRTQEDCPEDSVCCDNPCLKGVPTERLCFPVEQESQDENKSNEKEAVEEETEPEETQPEGQDLKGDSENTEAQQAQETEAETPTEAEEGKQETAETGEQSETTEADAAKSENPVDESEPKEEVLPPNSETETKTEEGKSPQLEGGEQPPTGEVNELPTPTEESEPSKVIEKEEKVTDDRPPQCPKPTVICDGDGKKCSVACPAYGPEVTTCKTDDNCTSDRLCCPDPCPQSPVKLCFPRNKNEEQPKDEPKSANLIVNPPEEEATKETKEPEAIAKKKEPEFVCPLGDFTNCIGWSPVPGKKGTGVCKKNDHCAEGRLCCKITECNDGIKHCVPQFDKSTLEPGCPIPTWSKKNGAKSCKKGCSKGKICCLVDMQGTRGCVDPTE